MGLQNELSIASEHLPDDWWKTESTCKIFADLFARHMLGLFVAYSFGNQLQTYVFSGAKLYHSELLFWITAGHVIDKLNKIRNDPKITIKQMQWFDGGDIDGAKTVPAYNRAFKTFSTYEGGRGVDIGVGYLDGLEAALIVSNPKARYLTRQAWKNVHLSSPEGFYMVGYPAEWGAHIQERLTEKQTKHSFQADLACLPVTTIDYRGPIPNDKFWDDPDAFYGQILPYSDVPGSQPENIDGMSGGPIFSIERTAEGRMKYWPFGIQRSWKRDERIVRVEPIDKIVSMLEGED